MNEAVSLFVSFLQNVLGYSDKTIISYKHDLDCLQNWLENKKIDFTELKNKEAQQFTAYLYTLNFKTSTINRIISACKSFYRYLCKTDAIDYQPFKGIVRAKKEQRIPTVLSVNEIEKLLNYPYKNYSQLLDVTLFNLFYSTGCRLSELVNVKLSDIDIDEKRIKIRGKGNKDRYVFLTDKAIQLLEIYKKSRYELLRNLRIDQNDTLLLNKKGKKLPLSTIHIIFEKYRVELGFTKKLTPHVLRHTFATHLLDNNLDIRLLQELLGHKSIGTTQIYTHITGKKLEDVYMNTHPHGRKNEF